MFLSTDPSPIRADGSGAPCGSGLVGAGTTAATPWRDLRPYGVAVRVVCTGALEQDQESFANHIQKRLEARSVQVWPQKAR
jgi:hypothetical protein